MSNIEDDLKAKGFIEGYKQIKNNASIIKSIDKDFFFELVDFLLEEREQDKARIKELEEENASKQKAYDDCYCEYKHYKQFDSIPKRKVKDYLKEEQERFEVYKKECKTNENLKFGMFKHLGAKNICEKILGIEKNIVTLD